jgi:hypothetical protein
MSPAVVVLLIAVAVVGSQFFSAYLHPFKPCSKCKGAGIHKGSVFSFSHRSCTKCGGKSRTRRVGAPSAGKAFGEGKKR